MKKLFFFWQIMFSRPSVIGQHTTAHVSLIHWISRETDRVLKLDEKWASPISHFLKVRRSFWTFLNCQTDFGSTRFSRRPRQNVRTSKAFQWKTWRTQKALLPEASSLKKRPEETRAYLAYLQAAMNGEHWRPVPTSSRCKSCTVFDLLEKLCARIMRPSFLSRKPLENNDGDMRPMTYFGSLVALQKLFVLSMLKICWIFGELVVVFQPEPFRDCFWSLAAGPSFSRSSRLFSELAFSEAFDWLHYRFGLWISKKLTFSMNDRLAEKL